MKIGEDNILNIFKNLLGEKEEQRLPEPEPLPETAMEIYEKNAEKQEEQKQQEEQVMPEPTKMTETSFKPNHSFIEPPKSSSDRTFFDQIQAITQNKTLEPSKLDNILNKNLLEEMKQFYLHEKDGEQVYTHPEEIKKALSDKVQHLKGLEDKWYGNQRTLNNTKKNLSNTEEEIELALEELKEILGQVKSNVELKPKIDVDQYFFAHDGQVFKNFKDLKSALRDMPKHVFEHHVSKEKNDFANWIRGVFKNKELACAIEMAQTKGELISLFDNFS